MKFTKEQLSLLVVGLVNIALMLVLTFGCLLNFAALSAFRKEQQIHNEGFRMLASENAESFIAQAESYSELTDVLGKVVKTYHSPHHR